MRFTEIVCSDDVADKLWRKHNVDLAEVDEMFESVPHVRRGTDGLYFVFGCAESGRHLLVILSDLGDGRGRLVTARQMTSTERQMYERR